MRCDEGEGQFGLVASTTATTPHLLWVRLKSVAYNSEYDDSRWRQPPLVSLDWLWSILQRRDVDRGIVVLGSSLAKKPLNRVVGTDTAIMDCVDLLP